MSEAELLEDKVDPSLDFALWAWVLRFARPYRRALIWLALAGIVLAIADVCLPLITKWIIDDATTPEGGGRILALSLLYLGLVGVISGMIWIFIIFAGRAATGMAYDIRRAAFAHLQALSFSFYDERPVGWLMARLTSDCSRFSSIIPWCLLDLVWGSSFLTGICVVMLLLDWRLALLVMTIIPLLAVISLIFQKKLIRSQRLVRKTNSQLTASFNEGIMGVRTTKALVREEQNLGEFQGLSTRMYDHSVRNMLQAAVYLPLVMTLGGLGVGLALWRGGLDLGPGAEISLGTLVAFMQYAALLYIPIQEMAARFTEFQAAQASAERVQTLLDVLPEITDTPEAISGDGYLTRIETIEFRQVSFAYRGGEKVLDRFDLRVEAGECIALVGPTGSGKSTIVSLVSRFYEPTGGTIALNGRDYRYLRLDWLQSNLGIVQQTPHLFRASIRENIRYGRLEASDEEVRAAASQVNAEKFIAGLEEGYDTDVGENGNALSTGQKQLVSLARAVLADPQIFILDEATSSVDTETEQLIQAGIERVLEGRISFIIAHRLSTVRRADRIIVIDHGRILEEGDHEELLRRRGHYHNLYLRQFADEARERLLAARQDLQ